MKSAAFVKAAAAPRVLVVEDEALVSLMLEDMLDDMGCEIVGPAASVSGALALVREGGFDAALLDVNLGGEPVFPVADALTEAGVPFIFVTGYGRAGLRGTDASRPVVQKPYSLDQLRSTLRSAGILG